MLIVFINFNTKNRYFIKFEKRNKDIVCGESHKQRRKKKKKKTYFGNIQSERREFKCDTKVQ